MQIFHRQPKRLYSNISIFFFLPDFGLFSHSLHARFSWLFFSNNGNGISLSRTTKKKSQQRSWQRCKKAGKEKKLLNFMNRKFFFCSVSSSSSFFLWIVDNKDNFNGNQCFCFRPCSSTGTARGSLSFQTNEIEICVSLLKTFARRADLRCAIDIFIAVALTRELSQKRWTRTN